MRLHHAFRRLRPESALVVTILLSSLFTLAVAEEPAVPEPPAVPSPTSRSGPAPGVAMNNFYLDRALREMTGEVEGADGRWQFRLYDLEMVLISDEAADRMRVIAPVAEAGTLDKKQLRFLMEVNFDRALDAKYAIWQDTVWATFVHPLSLLSAAELKAGVMQVISLERTYGTDYTSTGLVFAQRPGEGDQDGGN